MNSINARRQEDNLTGIAHLVGRLMMLPMVAVAYGIRMLIKTMEGIQDVSNQSMEVVVGPQTTTNEPSEFAVPPVAAVQQDATIITDVAGATITNQLTHKEEQIVSTNGNYEPGQDRDLHDDMLKLVRYKILFVRREYEIAFPEQEDLVPDNMDGAAFTAWKIAEFIQNLHPSDSTAIPSTHTRIPDKWREKKYAEEFWQDGYLTGVPHEDKKYLRVYYEVLERYPREKFKYEEQQIRVLEEIRDKL